MFQDCAKSKGLHARNQLILVLSAMQRLHQHACPLRNLELLIVHPNDGLTGCVSPPFKI
jgi:hypothetical protein